MLVKFDSPPFGGNFSPENWIETFFPVTFPIQTDSAPLPRGEVVEVDSLAEDVSSPGHIAGIFNSSPGMFQ